MQSSDGAAKTEVFSWRLKVLVSVSSCSEDGGLFQAPGPAHKNELQTSAKPFVS